MKKYKVVAILILLGAMVPSCKKFLEEDPQGKITSEYLSTESGLKDLTVAAYYGCRNITDMLSFLGNAASDEWTWGQNGSVTRLLTECRTNDMISSGETSTLWNTLYSNINNLNFGLNTLPKITFTDQALKNSILGELSFLRAWQYYLVVETWGEGAHFQTVPSEGLVTEGHQAKIWDFYKLILSDIDVAITKLPAQPKEQGRASAFASKALKAKILLSIAGYSDDVISKMGTSKMQLYKDAKALADDVIANSGRKLLTEYASVFDVNNQNNNEVLWAVQFSANLLYNSNGQHLHRYWVSQYNKSARTGLVIPKLPAHSILYGREFRWIMPTKWLLNLYNTYDKRYDGSFQTVYMALSNEKIVPGDTALIRSRTVVDNATATAYKNKGVAIDGINDYYDASGVPTVNGRSSFIILTKFLDPSRTIAKEEDAHKNVIILRLAEMYLIGAECAYNLGDRNASAKYITDLRLRDIVPGHSSDLSVDPAKVDVDYILDERSRELAGELTRWFDLKRTNKLVERVKKYNPDALFISDIHNVRPIPISELNSITNKSEFKQNPGYPSP